MALIIAAVLKNIKRYRYYRSFYLGLPFKRFYRNADHVYSHRSGEKDDGFIWLLNRNSFSLGNGHYLSSTFLDPVAAYWKRMFIIWFKENVNPHFLTEYKRPSSYASNIKPEHEFPSAHAYDCYLRRYYASVALRAIATQEALNEALVRDVMEVANKLVAELRFKEKTSM